MTAIYGNLTEHSRKVIQKVLDQLKEWADGEGFKISKEKTIAIHFSRRQSKNSELRLGGKRIVYVNETKYLGMIIDRKLTWKNHIELINERCRQTVETY